MEMSILLKFLTLKWNISRTICSIEVGDGSLFCIFHTLSFELNFCFDRRFPLSQLTAPLKAQDRVSVAFFMQEISHINMQQSIIFANVMVPEAL